MKRSCHSIRRHLKWGRRRERSVRITETIASLNKPALWESILRAFALSLVSLRARCRTRTCASSLERSQRQTSSGAKAGSTILLRLKHELEIWSPGCLVRRVKSPSLPTQGRSQNSARLSRTKQHLRSCRLLSRLSRAAGFLEAARSDIAEYAEDEDVVAAIKRCKELLRELK